MTTHTADTLPPEGPIPAGTRNRDIVGITQIADRLEVTAATVYKWQQRAHAGPRRIPIPAPNGYASATPWWTWKRIAAWAEATGRLQTKVGSDESR